jgi:hypothetical protein
MSAHPMIQPADWTIFRDPSGADLEARLPSNQAALMRIVRDCAVANALIPPRLLHTRYVWQTSAGAVAAVVVTPASEAHGYWRVRQDWPSQPYPINLRLNGADIPSVGWKVTSVKAVPSRPLTIARLIDQIQALGICTPAALAPRLRALFAESNQWAKLPGDARDELQLRPKAAADVQRWRQMGISCDTRPRQRVLDDLIAQELSLEQAIDQAAALFGTQATEAVKEALKRTTEQWAGMGQAEARALLRGEDVAPPQLRGLPRWLDPEQQLKPDHPLRKLRVLMEKELAQSNQHWSLLTDWKRRELREAWLNEHQQQGEQALELLTASDFDVLKHWLLGPTGR